MIDLGLFLADSFSLSIRGLEDRLSALAGTPIQGGLLHLNPTIYTEEVAASDIALAVDARQLGLPEVNLSRVRFVSYRQGLTEKPHRLSALLAKTADIGATLFLPSPYSEGQSSSQELGARAGYRQVNYALAKALLTYACEEARYYGTKLHVLGVSSVEELDLIQPYRDMVTASVPLYLFQEGDSYGYGWAGRLAPGPISESEGGLLLSAMKAGKVDAVTSHHHIYSELLELDPLSAETGAETLSTLSALLRTLRDVGGDSLFEELTVAGPKRILHHA